MQTTLEVTNIQTVPKVDVRSINHTDEYADYLYRNFSYEGMLEHQIQEHLLEEKAETDEIKREYEYLQQFEEFRPKRKSQDYIRVGKHDDN